MIVLYRSCRGNTLRYGIPHRAVLQNHLINDVAALDATKDSTGAMPVIAVKIDTHVRDHMTAASTAGLSSELFGSQFRCLGPHGVHVNLLPSGL
jgi:hypothetical protein